MTTAIKKFHKAIVAGDAGQVLHFAKEKIPIYGKNEENFSILFMAIRKKNVQILKILIKYYWNRNSKIICSKEMSWYLTVLGCRYNDLNTIKALTEFKCSTLAIKRKHFGSLSLLHGCVIYNYDTTICKYLLDEQICDINKPDTNKNYANTPLHLACSISRIEFVKLFCSYDNIDFNVLNADGNTALHLACHNDKNIEIIQYLFQQKGVNVTAVNRQNQSIFQICIDKGTYEIYKFLLKYFYT